MAKELATIGYEAATQGDVIQRLKDAGVDIVIDVRAVAASRRAGFSKTLLAGSLNEAGIDYLHLRDLGTPKEGRIAARAGRVAEMHRIFEAHLEEPAAQLALAEAAQIASNRKAALLCYEAEAGVCHRRIVADLIQEKTGAKIVDL
ncbi:MAG TPA: DUF488 domain-containing protein [Caulobacteraceae bacterium]